MAINLDLIIGTFCFFALIFGGMYLSVEAEQADIRQGRVCGGMAQSLYHIGYECCSACENVGMEYVSYEYDKSMIHADVDNCFCLDNKTYVQIW